ncbi:MAG: hypothetical protein CBE38_03000 [Gammaproteobacteria bacterium TMED278]|nr:hypothetical protein [Gammaproteobacteria bacterium]OUX42321.1 MAG: hypothetical protein CBE38_03000 [Gammaproteobacteria bacterium TMED278]
MNITNIKSTYGYIGFIPFAFFSVMPWIVGGEISKTFIIIQLSYGAIIISFLGGFAWGWRDNQKNQKINLSLGIGFSLAGCLILLLIFLKMILISLIISIIAFYGFYIFEKSTEDFKKKDIDYQKFRKILTLLVCISFLISSWYWINPYSYPYL